MADGDLAVLDNLHAPDFFADDAMSFSLIDGTVRVIFTVIKHTQPPPGQPVRVVTGRLVMGVDATQRMVVGLNNFLESVGHSPSDALKGRDQVN